MTYLRGLALVLGLSVIGGTARATPEDEAGAERLFQEAKGLLAEGRVHDACARLAEAKRLEIGGGIILALAVCHAKEGRDASALVEFREGLALAIDAKRADRVRLAEQEIARLDGAVSKLTLIAPDGVDLRVNQEAWDRARIGVAVPVDAGDYVVRAEAPGKRPWELVLHLAGEQDSRRVDVPPLADLDAPPAGVDPRPEVPVAVPEPDASPPHGDGKRTRRIAGLVVGAAGVVGVGVGAAFGLVVIHDREAANCNGTVCPGNASMYASAKTDATVSDVALIAGGVALGAGALLLLTSRADAPAGKAAVWLAPQVSRTGGSIGLAGRF